MSEENNNNNNREQELSLEHERKEEDGLRTNSLTSTCEEGAAVLSQSVSQRQACRFTHSTPTRAIPTPGRGRGAGGDYTGASSLIGVAMLLAMEGDRLSWDAMRIFKTRL